MERRAERGPQAGFIITLELILIFTILGIGLFVGIAAIRNALFVHALKKQSDTVWVYDANNVTLGPARDFDEHEAPRLFYIDRSLIDSTGTFGGHNWRAFIGVRHDRFTSRQRIFYTDTTCGASGGRACIAPAGRADSDSQAIGTVASEQAGGISYLYPLQGGPSYGIGRDLSGAGGLPGTLYRELASRCAGPTVFVRSAWVSQTVSGPVPPDPPPCEVLPDPGEPASSFAGAEVVMLNGAPVLSTLTPPFYVNLPLDPAVLQNLAPGGFEGAPGIPAGPYTPPAGVQTNVPPPGEGGHP